MERRLKEKEEAAKQKEQQLQARIDQLETKNVEFKLEMLAQQDSSDDQKKENYPKSVACKGKPICIFCQEKFNIRAELKAHIGKMHKQSSANSCPPCYKDFKSKKSLSGNQL